MSCDVRLDKFEGPLDLLLHLIKKNEMDIYDIQIVDITIQYLAFIDEMKQLNLDVAGEYLVMAATLLYLKSRLLLPQPDEEQFEEDEADPRAELVRRLLEYQRYKDVARSFTEMPQLDRDVFTRIADPVDQSQEMSCELEPVGLYELVDAMRSLLRSVPPELVHEVTQERLSVTDRVTLILELLQARSSMMFEELFISHPIRSEIVVSFLALLELVKMKMVKIYQNSRCGSIMLFPAVIDENSAPSFCEDDIGYA